MYYLWILEETISSQLVMQLMHTCWSNDNDNLAETTCSMEPRAIFANLGRLCVWRIDKCCAACKLDPGSDSVIPS